jgi:hypothetical protein
MRNRRICLVRANASRTWPVSGPGAATIQVPGFAHVDQHPEPVTRNTVETFSPGTPLTVSE